MSDDIVTRLREFGDSYGLDAEAADEIERLRLDRDRWRNISNSLAEAAEIQVNLTQVPAHYTKPWYSRDLKDAIAEYEAASND